MQALSSQPSSYFDGICVLLAGGGAERGGNGSTSSTIVGEAAEENRGTEKEEAMARTRAGKQVSGGLVPVVAGTRDRGSCWSADTRSLMSCFSRPSSSDRRVSSPSNTPPEGGASPSPTPPATPARRGDFVRREYAMRHQLRLMDDLEKVLQQKTGRQGRPSAKKAQCRPRSMTREETAQLSLSPAKGSAGKNTLFSSGQLNRNVHA